MGLGIELHTDRIRRETGAPVVCDVLVHDLAARTRAVALRPANMPPGTAHTWAYTRLAPEDWTDNVAAVDRQLQRGSLMGETFRASGLTVRQNRLLQLRLPVFSRQVRALHGLRWWQLASVECYEFWAGATLYGTVLEVRRPNNECPPRPAHGRSHAWLRRNPCRQGFTKRLDAPNQPATPRLLAAKLWGHASGLLLYGQAMLLAAQPEPVLANLADEEASAS